MMAGCTLLFQAYLDAMLLAALTLIAIALVPTSPIRLGLFYAAGALGAGCLIASFFLLWGARLSSGNWLRWIYDRPSMASFRMAQPSQYLKLFGIRLLIVLGAGLALYGQFVSFHIGVSLAQTLALTPFIVAIGNSALSPGGIGTTQLVYHAGLCPVRLEGRSVRTVSGRNRLQFSGPDANGTGYGSAARARSGRGRKRIRNSVKVVYQL